MHHENLFLVFKKYHYSNGYLLLAPARPLVAKLEAQVTSNFPKKSEVHSFEMNRPSFKIGPISFKISKLEAQVI